MSIKHPLDDEFQQLQTMFYNKKFDEVLEKASDIEHNFQIPNDKKYLLPFYQASAWYLKSYFNPEGVGWQQINELEKQIGLIDVSISANEAFASAYLVKGQLMLSKSALMYSMPNSYTIEEQRSELLSARKQFEKSSALKPMFKELVDTYLSNIATFLNEIAS